MRLGRPFVSKVVGTIRLEVTMLTLPFRNLVQKTAKRALQSNVLFRQKSSKGQPSESTKVQEAALNENLFLVDEQDKVVGRATKRECHEVKKCGEILLHRAFSVFLFNGNGDLLLQKRAAEKVLSSLFQIYF